MSAKMIVATVPVSRWARLRDFALAHPGLTACAILVAFILPTLGLPLCARDYYHLDLAVDYQVSRFWEADTFVFREYFWWPWDGYWGRYFRPLWMGIVVVLHWIFDLEALPYRLTWLAMYLGAIGLFAGVLRRARLGAAATLLACVLFAIHPSRCALSLEPVAVGLLDGSLTLCFMASLYGFVRWREEGWAAGRWLAFVAFVLGLCAKELAVVIPAVFVVYDLAVPPRDGARRSLGALFRRHASFWAVLAVYLPLYFGLVARGSHIREPYYLAFSTTASWLPRMLRQAALYAGHSLVPGPYHPLADAEIYGNNPLLFVGYGGLAAALYGMILRRAWRHPWARFALGLLVLSLLPVLPVIVQLQEFMIPAAGTAILIALAFEASGRRARALVATAAVGVYGAALAAGLTVCAAGALESQAHYAALRREVPVVAPGTRFYFVNSTQVTLMGHAAAIRLLYDDRTLQTYHLSFDHHDLPSNPTTALGGLLVEVVENVPGTQVGQARPQVVRTSDRGFRMRADGLPFFDSHVGRFALQGRAPFHVGEAMRWDELTARVEAMDGRYPTEIAFEFAHRLDDPGVVFLYWDGARLVPLFAEAP